MALDPTMATAVFGLYIAVIHLLFGIVFYSITPKDKTRLLEQKPFLFLRCAFGALLSTWYFMISFMMWSYHNDAQIHGTTSVGEWLSRTSLFEQAWKIVCTGPQNWWWSSHICTFTVIMTAIIWVEGRKRDIRFVPAYMLLGQMVAISVALALFLTALSLRPVNRPTPSCPPTLYLPLFAAIGTIFAVPTYVQTEHFLANLLWMHGLLVVPLISWGSSSGATTKNASNKDVTTKRFNLRPATLYSALIGLAFIIHGLNAREVINTASSTTSSLRQLYNTIFSHSAQASISLDVVWVAIILAFWWMTTGSLIAVVFKIATLASAAGVGVVAFTGVNWRVVASIVPIFLLLAFGLVQLGLNQLRKRNIKRRKALLEKLKILDNEVIPGTDRRPPTKSPVVTMVGFFHPYCDSGGGGERVLWSAIAYLQRTQQDVVSLVYTGDFPSGGTDADKERIINNVHTRFSIKLDPATLHFIPLPSRYLISDGYYNYFTLLNQSLGSIYLAWEGLCGKEGLWGDIFLDTMGYALTFPLVRLIGGPSVTIGAYVHYPTVSTDMVKRVKARTAGIEDGGAAKSYLKTRIKLIYYKLFTTLYATSLLFSEEVMTNSSWTHAHITNLLNKGRTSFLASLLLMDDRTREIRAKNGEIDPKAGCRVVFPPCDTEGLQGLGNLGHRKRELVSLAQFRPEKEHAKQVQALAILFKDHPEYRSGDKRIHLTMMGGTRNQEDKARAEGLRQLATELGVIDNVELLENAPYGEIVKRLGEASIGLNTMQDEHFGINVVEFMAAGLISVVHASAGPLLDIVVPHNGQRTGFHATDAPSFAEAIHQALQLSNTQATKMRQSARALAKEKFSLRAFEKSWEKSWGLLKKRSRVRRAEADGAEYDRVHRV